MRAGTADRRSPTGAVDEDGLVVDGSRQGGGSGKRRAGEDDDDEDADEDDEDAEEAGLLENLGEEEMKWREEMQKIRGEAMG